MGLDASIYITAKTTNRDPNVADLRTFLTPAPDRALIGITHEVQVSERYWGPDYRRGNWPYLCSILMALLAAPEVDHVWYGHDHGFEEMTPELLREYTTAYLDWKPWK